MMREQVKGQRPCILAGELQSVLRALGDFKDAVYHFFESDASLLESLFVPSLIF